MKKTIAFLIESELEKAEVILAARTLSDALQKMTETASKMEAEDLMPLIDPIREHYGPEASATFNDAVTEKLRHLVEVLSETKTAISDEIARLQGEDIASDDLTRIGDDEPEDELDMEIDIPEVDVDMDAGSEDVEADSDEEVSDLDLGLDDLDIGRSAAGRIKKESVEIKNADRKLIREYVEMIREGKSALVASRAITDRYGISHSTLVSIVESAKR